LIKRRTLGLEENSLYLCWEEGQLKGTLHYQKFGRKKDLMKKRKSEKEN
jgi:hypothetical protein